MKKLRDLMQNDFLLAVPRNATVADASRTMHVHNVGIVVVLEGGELVGLFSERDAVRRVIDRGLDPARTTIGEVMTREVIVADENEDYRTAMRRMDQANIRHLPITRDGQVVSMLSIRDLMRVDLQRLDEELRLLHEYVHSLPPEAVRGLGQETATPELDWR